MRWSLSTWLFLVIPLAACSVDSGRTVRPVEPPVNLGTTDEASGVTIPLAEVRKSQAAAVTQRVANTEIAVTYSRPTARGRALFGSLVPLDQVWNPGADRATAVRFSRGVTVNGRPLGAGRYSLWVIPRETTWTLIFSGAADVYHTPYPGEAQDVLRLDVEPEAAPYAEVMTFDFPTVDGKSATLRLHWGATAVPMTIVVP